MMLPAGNYRKVSHRAAAALAAVLALAAGSASLAEDPQSPIPEPASREESLRRELEEVKARLGALERERESGSGARPGGVPAGEEPPLFGRERIDTPAPLRGVFEKPFLAGLWRQVHIGGYTELEYHDFGDGVLGVPRGFRAHRTNLFAFAEVSDYVRFASELEFEHDGPGEEVEIKLEMAFVDWVLFEEFTLRAGALLAPLGRVNLNHDGPTREITDRPLVSTFVIPTTLTEPGAGALGAIRLPGPLSISYEAYLTNGFRLLDRSGQLAAGIADIEQLLREGRPSLGGDSNDTPATTGRVALDVFKALEIGGSWHIGTYDERDDNILAIAAADLAFSREICNVTLALEGEFAVADFQRDTFARTAGIPDRFWGFYVQGSASHMPRFLVDAIPHVFGGEGAGFTAVLRYDSIDLDGDRAGALEPGINFRPFADTVFKFSYRFGLKSLGLRNVPGRRNFDDEGFVFSLSSYF